MNAPWNSRNGQFSWLKASVFGLCLLPGMLTAYWFATGAFGALAVKAAMKYVGLWSVRILLVALTLTPLQRFLALGKLAQVRRIVGVTAASYAAIHFTLYLAFMDWGLSRIVSEITTRFYLILGAVALVVLLTLAFTSTDRSISRLGSKWKRLHQLVYPLTLLALVHMALQEKIDATASLQLFGLFVLLMSYRVVLALRLSPHGGVLLIAAFAAAVTTGALEALWYATLSGISPVRVIAANMTLSAGLRPSQLVLVAGLIIAAVAHVRNGPRRLKPAFITR